MDNLSKDSKFYISFRRYIVITVLKASLIPFLMVIFIIGYSFHASYKHMAIQNFKEIVKSHAEKIDNFLKEKILEVKILSEIIPIEKLKNSIELNKILRNYKRDYIDLGLIDENGNQISYAGPFNLIGANYKNAKWFKEMKIKSVYISDVFLGLRNLPHFIIAIKIKEQKHFYILRATINFFKFTKLVENLGSRNTGKAYIINLKGKFQTNKPSFSLLKKDIILKKISNYEKSDIICEEYKNVLWIGKFIKDGKWLLIYEQNKKEAFHLLYKIRILVVVISIISIIFIIFLSNSLSHDVIDYIKEVDKEKKMLTQQIIKSERLAAIGELASGVAHEVNNPVGIMVEEAGWMQDLLPDIEDICIKNNKQDVIEEFKKSIEQIKLQGKRCKEITKRLLNFARGGDTQRQLIDVNKVLEELVTIISSRAKKKNIDIVLNLSKKIPMVFASYSELQQVFLNIINNSFDAMEKGGVLRIKTSSSKEFVIVQFSDTGHGIPKELISKIFDPFFTTKPVGKGTGLGLSICYGIIKNLGGDITVTSTPSSGTTFKIFLPKSKQETSYI